MSKETIKNRVCMIRMDGDFSTINYGVVASAEIINRIKNVVDCIEKDYIKEWEKKNGK